MITFGGGSGYQVDCWSSGRASQADLHTVWDVMPRQMTAVVSARYRPFDENHYLKCLLRTREKVIRCVDQPDCWGLLDATCRHSRPALPPRRRLGCQRQDEKRSGDQGIGYGGAPAPASGGLLFHSDRGSQYCSYDYQKKLQAYGLRPSMSGRDNCYDDTSVETFFKSLKAELISARHQPARGRSQGGRMR